MSIRQLAVKLEEAFVPPKRGRGRPQKERKKTPCLLPFEAVATATAAIPPDTSGQPGRNRAKERARKIVAKDGRIQGKAPGAIIDFLLDDVRWKKGFVSHSLNHLAKETECNRSTVKRALTLLEDCGHLCRRSRPKARGDSEINEFALPVLVTAWSALSQGVGANNSGGWAQENTEPDEGWAQETSGGGRKKAPHPSGTPSEEGSCCGSAHARASTEDEVLQSFLNGEDLAKSDGLTPAAPDGLTEEHFEAFRHLADTFGRRHGQTIVLPTTREVSDRILIGLVATELRGFRADIVERAVSHGLRSAECAGLAAQQDGSAGRGRGGINSLNNYLRPTLRSTAAKMLREEDATEAENRSEKVVQETRHATRVNAVQSGGRSQPARRRSWSDLADEVFGTPDGDHG